MTDSTMPTHLISDLSTVPITALQLATRNLISSLLNPLKVLPNENGLPRDWRGLAHLIGLRAEKIPVISCDSDPTARVLILWQKQDSANCTIKQFREFLGELDRYDIVDDAADMIENDISRYLNTPENVIKNEPAALDEADMHILTVDDVCRIDQGLGTQTYDAFVVFADEDIDFATQLIEIMEKQYGFKLCVKERDLVAGLPFEHKAIIELISERCNRLIVIISPAYLKSSANKFVVNYAQALGIEQGKRKIIPCLYEPCDVPQELRLTFMLKYQSSGRLYNFWEKLRDSLQVPTVQSSPKLKVSRPLSQEIRTSQSELMESATFAQTETRLKPKKEIRFGSCSNLTAAEASETKRFVSANALNSDSSSSTESNTTEVKKEKNKAHRFLKKYFKYHKKNEKKDTNGLIDKQKKKKSWWPTIKVPAV